MNKSLLPFFVVAVLMSAVACRDKHSVSDEGQSSEQVEVNRKSRYFSVITVCVPCNVSFKQADSTSVRIVGVQRDVSKIVTIHDRNELVIKSKPFQDNKFENKNFVPVDIYITSPDLTAVNMKGLGNFNVDDHLDTDTLRVKLQGMGNVTFSDVVCDEVTVLLKGNGQVKIENVNGNQAWISLLGLGNIMMGLHEVENTHISFLGEGNIDVNFDRCKSAVCKLVGMGSIKLTGSLEKQEKTLKGNGYISTKGLNVK